MANVWPVTIPDNVLQGFQERLEDNLVKTNMDVGPAKRRLRSSSTTRVFDVEILVDKNQHSTFQTFFETTLKHGIDKFDWKNPSTGIASSNCYIETPTYNWVTAANCSVKFSLLIRPY